jgi:hypothetical protein
LGQETIVTLNQNKLLLKHKIPETKASRHGVITGNPQVFSSIKSC